MPPLAVSANGIGGTVGDIGVVAGVLDGVLVADSVILHIDDASERVNSEIDQQGES